MPGEPEVVLVAQHGWADNNRAMLTFGRAVASPDWVVVAPDLGYRRTWHRMAPLVDSAEQTVEQALAEHPTATLRIVGHSMGGLIWIELLTRRPDWRARTDRLSLIGCPIAGAELAALLDPIGLTIARDLQVSRREIAEAVAHDVPTLVIVGDLFGPHDGTVSHTSAHIAGARFVQVPSSSHAGLRSSRWVLALVRAFHARPDPPPVDLEALAARLRAVPGMREVVSQSMPIASVSVMFEEGATIRTLGLAQQVHAVFVANRLAECQFAGYVVGRDCQALDDALQAIRAEHANAILRLSSDRSA